MEAEPKWDIILAGESAVGKTSMILRYVKDVFYGKAKTTVAVDLFIKMVRIFEKDVVLNIWDSAGQEVYKSVVPMYFRKAHGCILVYDVTRINTFHSLSGWLLEFRHYNDSAPVIIVGNKSEDPNTKSVALSVVKSFAKQEDMEFMECSAMTGHNVELAFETLIKKIWVNKMAEVALEENKEQISDLDDRDSPSLSSTLFHNVNRDSFVLTEADPEEENQQTSSSPAERKKKKKCC